MSLPIVRCYIMGGIDRTRNMRDVTVVLFLPYEKVGCIFSNSCQSRKLCLFWSSIQIGFMVNVVKLHRYNSQIVISFFFSIEAFCPYNISIRYDQRKRLGAKLLSAAHNWQDYPHPYLLKEFCFLRKYLLYLKINYSCGRTTESQYHITTQTNYLRNTQNLKPKKFICRPK